MTETEWGVMSVTGWVALAANEQHAEELTSATGPRPGWTVVSRTVTYGEWSAK